MLTKARVRRWKRLADEAYNRGFVAGTNTRARLDEAGRRRLHARSRTTESMWDDWVDPAYDAGYCAGRNGEELKTMTIEVWTEYLARALHAWSHGRPLS
jgi:hypothetical protein